jgi:hypothetical protein
MIQTQILPNIPKLTGRKRPPGRPPGNKGRGAKKQGTLSQREF